MYLYVSHDLSQFAISHILYTVTVYSILCLIVVRVGSSCGKYFYNCIALGEIFLEYYIILCKLEYLEYVCIYLI